MDPNKRMKTWMPVFLAVAVIFGLLIGIRLAPLYNTGIINAGLKHDKSKLNNILDFIETDYVDTVSLDSIEESAIDKVLESLDPHSQYISAADFASMNDPLLGSFEGIGVQFRIEKDTVVIIQPIEGGPSASVGILAGDRIIKVDGAAITGKKITNAEVMRKLKGKRGTKVDVTIFRRSTKAVKDFTITRDVIPTYSLDIAYMITSDIGYIKLNNFSATTHDEFVKAIDELKSQGLKKLILDLRNNSGGYLQSAIALCDEFLPDNELIVYTEGKSRPKSMSYATSKGIFEKEPLVVLIDEGSASASEITAGAIQDNDRGIIIGRRSFGKGLVQEQLNLSDGSALRLTVARYYTPSGRSIQRSYKNGREDYYNDFHQRIMKGEMQSEDSIHFPDSLKYTTKKGRTVYGGGGIMPDQFVPLESGEKYVYYNQLLNKGVMNDFAFDYTDTHRNELSRYRDFKQFNQQFRISDKMFEDLLGYADKAGITRDQKSILSGKEVITELIKALIGRNIFDNEGFYPVLNQSDATVQKAIGVLNQTPAK